MLSTKAKEVKKHAAEAILRVVFAQAIISIIISLIASKINRIVHRQAPLTAINVVNKTTEGIPIPNLFVCGQHIEHITVEKIPFLSERAILVEEYYLWKTNDATLKAGGDLTEGKDPCFIFQPNGTLKFKLTNDSNSVSIDYISIIAYSKRNISREDNNITLVGLWDSKRDISTRKTFFARAATINQLTNISINKQNTLQVEKFGTEKITAMISISPDSYMVTEYTETQTYGWIDLVGTIGGLLTYAIAVWEFLFGRGKYRSWGFVQRFLLRNSPNVKKLPLMKKEELFNEPSSSSPPTRPPTNKINPEYYVKTTGTPTQSLFRINNTPVSVDVPFSGMNDEILRKIDTINEKLWFLEQTLSRHYLAGFRLRQYYDDK
ncbi:2451_t:CDS:2 [Ambispora gerdemannii]|uniref:2451_t:CDS:1 n=1 Tax=Ambispora gerdemannii TaxID=144530 RepID=A0A9N9BLP5_9GLOM|nr:2451_t:CDS:2 [Ambispora gerdemannii]